MDIVSGQNDINVMYGFQTMKMKYKESEYYKELKLKWRRDYWTWERIHKLGRNSSDGGVRMMCEKLAVKIVKGIPLIENDIRFLDRTNVNTISKIT